MYISNFHKMYVRKLSSLRRIPKSADPVTTEHVIEHGRRFILTPSVDPRDLLLHAFLLTVMNCGMRFDKSSKVRLDSFKCTKYGMSFSVEERTKNDCRKRDYKIRRWPVSKLLGAMLMDPHLALALWL